MFKGTSYNPENKSYSTYIPVDEIPLFEEKCRKLKEKIQNATTDKPFAFESKEALDTLAFSYNLLMYIENLCRCVKQLLLDNFD